MQQPIDYAGLFPPAQLGMREALAEYGAALDSDDEWIVNRFVCPAQRVDECIGLLKEAKTKTGEDPNVEFSIVGTALTAGAGAVESIQSDQEQVKQAFYHGGVGTYEIRLPDGPEFDACLGAVKKCFNWFDERDVEVYLEVPWGPNMSEQMAKASSTIDGVCFKARTGGTTPEQFPDVRELASFLVEVAGLESLYKLTAGLHQPLRHYDSDLACFHHGFLNVMIAGALATIQHATLSEVEQVLSIEDPALIIFTDKTVEALGNVLTLKDIDEWWLFFGGFGSCSYREPIEGLQQVGFV